MYMNCSLLGGAIRAGSQEICKCVTNRRFQTSSIVQCCPLLFQAERVRSITKTYRYNIFINCISKLLHFVCSFLIKLDYILASIIEHGIREHPELSVGMTTEGIEVRSVGNTLTLHETALTEAFNLKAAIEYQLQNCNLALSQTSI